MQLVWPRQDSLKNPRRGNCTSLRKKRQALQIASRRKWIHIKKEGTNITNARFTELGISDVGSGTPAHGVQVLAAAIRQGTSVSTLAEAVVYKSMLDSAPRSLPRIASGLRCWHRFAIEVLNLQPLETLPPRDDSQVILYCSVFRNAGTCKNYISSLRFGCRLAKASLAWDTCRLKQAIRGVTKRSLSASKPRRRILRRLLLQLCRHAQAEQCFEESMVYAFSFVFLLRVGDECLSLEAGHHSESETAIAELPAHRHSSCWITSSEFTLRLRRRKNKFRGSTMRRGCLCNLEPDASDICPVHVLCKALVGKAPGFLLFPT